MDSLIKAIDDLKTVIYVPIDGVPVEELNSFLDEDEQYRYDSSASFRRKLFDKFPKAKITKLYACYYQGWECDEWAADISYEGQSLFVTTNHGHMHAE